MKENLNLIISVLSLTLTGISILFGIKTAIKKSDKQYLENKLSEEKRFLNSEERIAIVEERLSLTENLITTRLDDISNRISSLDKKFYKYLINN